MELVCVRAYPCSEFEWWAPSALTEHKASVVFVSVAFLNRSPSMQTVVKRMPNGILMMILQVTRLMHDVDNDVKIYVRRWSQGALKTLQDAPKRPPRALPPPPESPPLKNI